MRRKKTRRPSEAQLAAIGKIDAECRKLGAACCKRPDGISDKTWDKCYELGYIATADRDGNTPLVRVGSHGRGWLSSVPKAAIVRVPAKFYIDHDDRGCEPFCEPFKRSSRFVWLLSNDPGLDELLDDARHYADPDSFGSEYADLRRSAVATVNAIEAATASK